MGIEEGLGEAIGGLDFTVTAIEGDTVLTDSSPKKFDKGEYAPFNYQVGERYFRDVWENGEFVISERTGEAYLVVKGVPPTRVEGSLDKVVEKIQAEGKQNRFKRLLAEGRITAFVRIRSYDGRMALLEVALADELDRTGRSLMNPFEAYSVYADLRDGTAKIVEAVCSFGRFDEDISHFIAAKPAQLPQTIVEVARPREVLNSDVFKPLDAQSMHYIRENCHHHSSK